MNTSEHPSGALRTAAELIRNSTEIAAFTGAGISVESGIPPFRGPGGIWNRYDPIVLDIAYFDAHPAQAWRVIRELFFAHIARCAPNEAHFFLADLERTGKLVCTVTQNIDDLHRRAGSDRVVEYHGSCRTLVCRKTGKTVEAASVDLSSLPPMSPDGGVYKPGFVFFGEPIPARAAAYAESTFRRIDTLLVIGTTGEIYPAAMLPHIAARYGAKIIEINPERSEFTGTITDIHIPMKASEACLALRKILEIPRTVPGTEYPADSRSGE